MGVIQLDPKWNGLIDGELIDTIDGTDFLRRCRDHSVTSAELRQFTVQQHFYSKHFTRYLCALLSNIANELDRQHLTENLLEEIGYDPNGGQLPHATIYRQMMSKMGIDPARYTVLPSTELLIREMMDCCRDVNPMVGLGALCLGAEAIVPHVYSQIVEGFRGAGETDENLDFFHIHIEDDDAHAVTMLEIIERELNHTPSQRTILKDAAARVLKARGEFFNSLSQFEELTFKQASGGVFYEQLHV
jgi:pyrroloquinoline-quinone synthase